jgi:transposase
LVGRLDRIDALARHDAPVARALLGRVAVLTAMVPTAFPSIGTGDAFSKGRDFGAWLGLVPKQISTGDRTILGRITKRGNRYLHTLFIQGARVILLRPVN